MDTLRQIKKIASENPNDADFGEKVRIYLERHITCCDKSENIETFFDNGDGNPYGMIANGKKCKNCGRILSVDIK